jgi:hypothetical protein
MARAKNAEAHRKEGESHPRVTLRMGTAAYSEVAPLRRVRSWSAALVRRGNAARVHTTPETRELSKALSM